MTPDPGDLRARAATALADSRTRSLLLTDLDDDDLLRQHSPLMSPLVWDLAHIGNYEELWLLRAVGGVEPERPDLDEMYDAFKQPRASRPSLPLLGPADARSYVARVRERALELLDRADLDRAAARLVREGFVYGMVAQHEHQHDETMLATLQLRVGDPVLPDGPARVGHAGALPAEVLIPAGSFEFGTSLDPWAYDNERPAHTVDLPAFFLDTFPVSNGAYQSFVDAGGYDDPRWWTDAGWRWCTETRAQAPQFWVRDGAGWTRTRFGRVEPVPPDEPVQHVCAHEAAAYARWVGRRLPSEAEWEKAASWDPDSRSKRRYPWGNDEPTPEHATLAHAAGQRLGPAPVGAHPAGASAYGVQQLVGDVWEWTASSFTAYPGFAVFPYQEYSSPFFGPDYTVLRGGSWATHPLASRVTFRNWDYPIRRQIFAGFRTARDARPGEV